MRYGFYLFPGSGRHAPGHAGEAPPRRRDPRELARVEMTLVKDERCACGVSLGDRTRRRGTLLGGQRTRRRGRSSLKMTQTMVYTVTPVTLVDVIHSHMRVCRLLFGPQSARALSVSRSRVCVCVCKWHRRSCDAVASQVLRQRPRRAKPRILRAAWPERGLIGRAAGRRRRRSSSGGRRSAAARRRRRC